MSEGSKKIMSFAGRYMALEILISSTTIFSKNQIPSLFHMKKIYIYIFKKILKVRERLIGEKKIIGIVANSWKWGS